MGYILSIIYIRIILVPIISRHIVSIFFVYLLLIDILPVI